MRWKKYKLALLGLIWLVAPVSGFAQQTADWRELNAYSLGVQAYIYTFPWSYMTEARWTRTRPVVRQANRFDHFRKLKDASHLDWRRAQQ